MGVWFPYLFLSSNLGAVLVEYLEEMTQLSVPWTLEVTNEARMNPLGICLLHFVQKVKARKCVGRTHYLPFNLQVPILKFSSFFVCLFVFGVCEIANRPFPNLSDHSALLLKVLWDVAFLLSFLPWLDFNYNCLHRCQKLHYLNLALQPVTNPIPKKGSIKLHFQ